MSSTKSLAGWNFDNSYARLPELFYARMAPVPVRAPAWAIFNRDLARSLGLNVEALDSPGGVVFFSGNAIPEGAEPIAQAYAGHQFGHFNMLGDGRAHLLGEHVTPEGTRVDIQLKGSGPTPFSRRGDGRAALGPMLREFIVSEAMHALGIPTTRSLAVVTTGETIFRETPLPGAILTRVAASHIRVGTFEYAAAVKDPSAIRTLADYTIERHYPKLKDTPERYLALLQAVVERQAALIAKWMHVGFIHGVMNTDNVTLSGETIDYGPCAFMDHYAHATMFSSIDRNGRYAYGNQARIGAWNLARLAEAMLPLFHENQEQAMAMAKATVDTFAHNFEREWLAGMRSKLGLSAEEPGEISLIQDLLALMEAHQADYTNTFRGLSSEHLPQDKFFQEVGFKEWHSRWQARNPVRELMKSVNPVVIPRNHRVEEALAAATLREDYSVLERFLKALKRPFEESAEHLEYRNAPAPGGAGYQTFCGT